MIFLTELSDVQNCLYCQIVIIVSTMANIARGSEWSVLFHGKYCQMVSMNNVVRWLVLSVSVILSIVSNISNIRLSIMPLLTDV